MAAIAEAFVLVKPQTEGFQNQLKSQLNTVTSKASPNVKVNADTKGLQSNLTNQFKRIAAIGTGIFAGVFVFKGVADFLKGSIEKAQQAEEAQLKLNAAFSTFPKLADISAASLRTLNQQLASKTKFDKDTLASGEAVLAQFKLTGTQIKEIIPLVADYAARTGQDVPSAATALGRAFLGNTRALKTIGIQFKATGDTAKDFTTIQGLLASKVGGFAAKEGATFGGRLEIMRNQLGELQKTIGNAVLPVFAKIADFMVNTLFPNLRKVGEFLVTTFRPAFESVKGTAASFLPVIKGVGEVFAAVLVPALKLAGTALRLLGPELALIGAVFLAHKLVSGIAAVANGLRAIGITAGLAGGPLNILRAGLGSLTALFNPVTLLAAAFAGTIFVIAKAHSDAKTKVDSFASAIEAEANGMKGATDQFILSQIAQKNWEQKLSDAGVSLADFVRAIKGQPDAIERVGVQLNKLGGGATDTALSIDGTTTNLLALQKNALPLADVLELLQGQFAGGAKQAAANAGALKDLAGDTNKTTTSTAVLADTTTRFTRGVIAENKEVTTLQDRFKTISGLVDHFKTSLDATLGALLNIQDSTAKYDQDLAALSDALKQNGHSFDLNTQKGRDNSSALRAVVGDIEDQIGALVRGGKIQATDTAQKDALIGRLRQLEERFPALKGQVNTYIDAVNKTPVSRVTTFKANADTKSADKAAQNLIKHFDTRFDREGGSVPVTVKPQFTTPSLNVTATNVTVTGNVLKKAFGGFIGPGQISLVGEQGPELFIPQTAGTIIPNNKLQSPAKGFSSQDVDRIIQAIERAIQLSRPITVNEVAQSPVATAESVAARLGLAGVR